MRKVKTEQKELKMIRFGKLVFEALPEMWSFQLPVTIILTGLGAVLNALINRAASGPGGAMTTAGLKAMVLNWRFPVVLALGALMVLAYIVIELFSQIHLAKDILNGAQVRIFREFGAGIRSLRLFLTPAGIGILIYIFIAVPLCGVGFSISLTKNFHKTEGRFFCPASGQKNRPSVLRLASGQKNRPSV